jgi:hypothetical protein
MLVGPCCGAAAIEKVADQPDFAGLVYGGRYRGLRPGRRREPARRAVRLNRNLRPHLILTETGPLENQPGQLLHERQRLARLKS